MKQKRPLDTQLSLKLPASYKTAIKELAVEYEVSESTIVRWALRDYIEKVNKQ